MAVRPGRPPGPPPVGAMMRRAFLLAPALVLVTWAVLVLFPDRELRAFAERPYSLTITDRGGYPLQTLPLDDGLWRSYTPLSDLPEQLVTVFLKSEDERFYLHPGVDPVSLIRAVSQNWRTGEIVSGGSTITMQLARLIAPHRGGLGGKLREAVRAVRLEARLSKPEILEMWLNSIPFGSQIEGVTSAAVRIFGVTPSELSIEQTLLLAVIPRRPTRYDPRYDEEAASDAAVNLATRIGVTVHPMTIAEAARATRGVTGPAGESLPAPHFVRYVSGQLTTAQKARGFPIVTTLDIEIQRATEAAIRARVSGAAQFRIGNGAGIVIDNQTGEILAYVGSADFGDEVSSGQIDGVQIARQPGSTLKPFLYALALENGFTAATILPDIPTEFGSREIYVPENFNRRFNGPVRLRTALASSLNVPAVYTIERLGVARFAEFLLDLGFKSLESQMDMVGTGLALGNAEVTLAELARGFSVFVRDGVAGDLIWHARGPGRETSEDGRRVLAASSAAIIRSILSDELARVPGFGTRSLLDTAFEAMFKTGTSNQFNNIWALGSTAGMTAAVWMGNFGGETVIGAPGSSLPAAAVVEVLGLFADPGKPLPEPRDVHFVDICATSGLRATANCPALLPELFASGDDPEWCNWHTGSSEPVVYPPEYRSWALGRDYLVSESSGSFAPGLQIVRPVDGALFYSDPTVSSENQAIRVEILSDSNPVQLFVNGAFFAEGPSPLIVILPIRSGVYELTATVAPDGESPGRSVRSTITVR